MIKAENLRIGDLVRYGKNIITVQAIHTNYEEGFIIDEYNVSYNCDELDPIPLTSEILKKNGLKEEVVGEYYTRPLDNEAHPLARYLAVEWKSDSWVVFIKYYTFHDYALLRKIQHVHELQHILWALGEDAELKV